MAAKQTVVGAVIVDSIAQPMQVLAAKRQDNGLWEFPGGKVEPGELPEAALAREVGEELAVTITVGDQLGSTWPISDDLVLHLFLAVVYSGELMPDGSHSEVRWLRTGELGSVDWLPADEAALDQVRLRLT